MTHQETLKLAVEAKLALNTVKRWRSGLRVTEANRFALERAAKKLGVEIPKKEKEA